MLNKNAFNLDITKYITGTPKNRYIAVEEITCVSHRKGTRWYKFNRLRVMTCSIWTALRLRLSGKPIPWRISSTNNQGYLSDSYWENAHVIISISDKNHRIDCISNTAAKSLADEIKEDICQQLLEINTHRGCKS